MLKYFKYVFFSDIINIIQAYIIFTGSMFDAKNHYVFNIFDKQLKFQRNKEVLSSLKGRIHGEINLSLSVKRKVSPKSNVFVKLKHKV